jgi:hypothetical protein
MGWYIIGFLVLVVVFGVGFFVGGKHKARIMKAAGTLKDAVGTLKDTAGKL